MPQLTFPFDLNGMFVDVLLSCGRGQMVELMGKGNPVPRLWVRGIIDTGTNVSAVSRSILDQLGIPPGDPAQSEGVSGEFTTNYYEVSLTIADKSTPSRPTYMPPDVSVIHMEVTGVDVLIGLDLLMACRLVVDGRAGLFTLEF